MLRIEEIIIGSGELQLLLWIIVVCIPGLFVIYTAVMKKWSPIIIRLLICAVLLCAFGTLLCEDIGIAAISNNVFTQKIDDNAWINDQQIIIHIQINVGEAMENKYIIFSNVKNEGYVFRISKGGWAYREVKPDLSQYHLIKYRTNKGILLENGKIVPDGIPVETEKNPEVLGKLEAGEYYISDANIIRVVPDKPKICRDP